MTNLTEKELLALSDQLDCEKVLSSKYCAAAKECQDTALQSMFQGLSNQHKQNYDCLLNYLQ